MNQQEFSNQFDVLFNSITSNQAPGLNEYEKSLFLTKAQDELLKNYFLPQSNTKQAGFDGNQKRQMDFSKLMKVAVLNEVDSETAKTLYRIDPRSSLYTFPQDSFLIINESVHLYQVFYKGQIKTETLYGIRQIVSLTYEDYMRLMSKPYKNPNKNQAWRLMTNSVSPEESSYDGDEIGVELILTNTDRNWKSAIVELGVSREARYSVRYIRRPKPIILTDISDLGDNLTIGGCDGTEEFYENGNCCELDESLHEEVLQRAVELAKVSWTATGQDNTQAIIQTGQRSE